MKGCGMRIDGCPVHAQQRLAPPAELDQVPIWCWCQWRGERRRMPDLRHCGHLPRGTRGVRLGLELAEARLLRSDFELWHYVLNGGTCPVRPQMNARSMCIPTAGASNRAGSESSTCSGTTAAIPGPAASGPFRASSGKSGPRTLYRRRYSWRVDLGGRGTAA